MSRSERANRIISAAKRNIIDRARTRVEQNTRIDSEEIKSSAGTLNRGAKLIKKNVPVVKAINEKNNKELDWKGVLFEYPSFGKSTIERLYENYQDLKLEDARERIQKKLEEGEDELGFKEIGSYINLFEKYRNFKNAIGADKEQKKREYDASLIRANLPKITKEDLKEIEASPSSVNVDELANRFGLIDSEKKSFEKHLEKLRKLVEAKEKLISTRRNQEIGSRVNGETLLRAVIEHVKEARNKLVNLIGDSDIDIPSDDVIGELTEEEFQKLADDFVEIHTVLTNTASAVDVLNKIKAVHPGYWETFLKVLGGNSSSMTPSTISMLRELFEKAGDKSRGPLLVLGVVELVAGISEIAVESFKFGEREHKWTLESIGRDVWGFTGLLTGGLRMISGALDVLFDPKKGFIGGDYTDTATLAYVKAVTSGAVALRSAGGVYTALNQWLAIRARLDDMPKLSDGEMEALVSGGIINNNIKLLVQRMHDLKESGYSEVIGNLIKTTAASIYCITQTQIAELAEAGKDGRYGRDAKDWVHDAALKETKSVMESLILYTNAAGALELPKLTPLLGSAWSKMSEATGDQNERDLVANAMLDVLKSGEAFLNSDEYDLALLGRLKEVLKTKKGIEDVGGTGSIRPFNANEQGRLTTALLKALNEDTSTINPMFLAKSVRSNLSMEASRVKRWWQGTAEVNPEPAHEPIDV